jgi:hypothetical protein
MSQQPTIIIKALEDGVIVLFSIPEIESYPPERMDKGEVLLLPMPDKYPGIRIRGHAQVYTPDHIVEAESGLVIGGHS